MVCGVKTEACDYICPLFMTAKVCFYFKPIGKILICRELNIDALFSINVGSYACLEIEFENFVSLSVINVGKNVSLHSELNLIVVLCFKLKTFKLNLRVIATGCVGGIGLYNKHTVFNSTVCSVKVNSVCVSGISFREVNDDGGIIKLKAISFNRFICLCYFSAVINGMKT